jgi:hypothetical protein
LIPDGWYFKRVTNTRAVAAVAYFVTVENINARGSFDTGFSLNMILPRSQSEAVEPYVKASIAQLERQNQVLKPSWELTDGVFHRYGCLVRVQGKAGPLVVDHRAIVNTKTKTMFLLVFESPESQWEEAWAKGANVMELLSLDENR